MRSRLLSFALLRPPLLRPKVPVVPTRSFKMTSKSPPQPNKVFKVALCQTPVTSSKETNLQTAQTYLRRAHQANANLAVLPECFQCPYSTALFRLYAEPLPSPLCSSEHDSPSLTMLQKLAKETGMYIIGGSIPEIDKDQIYNTSLTVNPSGTLIAKHRKAHLFDIHIPGEISFRESDVLSPGDKATVFEAPELSCTIGVAICYDVRFPELAMIQARHLGASLLVFPGAFNQKTGPAHWELLMRARAVDNQVYVAACSPALDKDGDGYKAWGHSMVVNPWGEVLASAKEKEALVVVDINLAKIEEVRSNIPTSGQRRRDIYKVDYLK